MNNNQMQSWWSRNTNAITPKLSLVIALTLVLSPPSLLMIGAAAGPSSSAKSSYEQRVEELREQQGKPRPVPAVALSPAPAASPTTPPPLATQWSYNASMDGMTSKTSRYASITSSNTVSFGFPYTGEQHGRLLVRNHPRYGQDVLFSVDKGQILCSSMDCEVTVRFDEGAPSRWSATEPADNSTETIFLDNARGFRQRLAKAKVLRIEVPFYQEGSHTFIFNVAGYDPKALTNAD